MWATTSELTVASQSFTRELAYLTAELIRMTSRYVGPPKWRFPTD